MSNNLLYIRLRQSVGSLHCWICMELGDKQLIIDYCQYSSLINRPNTWPTCDTFLFMIVIARWLLYLTLQPFLFEVLDVIPGQFLGFTIVYNVSVVCARFFCIWEGKRCGEMAQSENERKTGSQEPLSWPLESGNAGKCQVCVCGSKHEYTPVKLSVFLSFCGCRAPDTISNVVL